MGAGLALFSVSFKFPITLRSTSLLQPAQVEKTLVQKVMDAAVSKLWCGLGSFGVLVLFLTFLSVLHCEVMETDDDIVPMTRVLNKLGESSEAKFTSFPPMFSSSWGAPASGAATAQAAVRLAVRDSLGELKSAPYLTPNLRLLNASSLLRGLKDQVRK